MPNTNVYMKGYDRVMSHIKKLSNPKETLKEAIRNTAIVSMGELQRATLSKAPASSSFKFGKLDNVVVNNLSTGDLSRAWTNPIEITDGYKVTNNKKAGKYSLAYIIEKGRKGLIAKPGHAFYLPLTRAGANKAPGAVPIGLKFGVDYILTKKIKEFKGNPYIEQIKVKASHYMTRAVIDVIRRELAS